MFAKNKGAGHGAHYGGHQKPIDFHRYVETARPFSQPSRSFHGDIQSMLHSDPIKSCGFSLFRTKHCSRWILPNTLPTLMGCERQETGSLKLAFSRTVLVRVYYIFSELSSFFLDTTDESLLHPRLKRRGFVAKDLIKYWYDPKAFTCGNVQ